MKKRVVLVAGILVCFFHTAFGQTQLVTNGGFELGFLPWQFLGTGEQLFTGNSLQHSGNVYLSMGNTTSGSAQAVYQAISFPTNTLAATFSYFVNIFSTAPSGADSMAVYLVSTNTGNFLTGPIFTNLDAELGSSSAPAQGNPNYLQRTVTVTPFTGQTNFSFYAGKTVWLGFYAVLGSGVSMDFNIDDVSLIMWTTADLPPNDYFTNRTVVNAVSIMLTATNVLATKEPGEPNHAGNAGGHSLWWTWTAPAIGTVTLKTTNSSFTTLLGVYTGSSVTNLSQVAADNGNGRSGGGAQVTFNVAAATQYQIAVDGYNGQSGTIRSEERRVGKEGRSRW